MSSKKLFPILLILVSVLCIASSFVLENIQSERPKTTQLEGITFEIVDTPAKQELGLSGRTTIPADYGMLFVFPKNDIYGIWMKDMKESIDILWLSDDETVVEMKESVAPDTYPTIFYPPTPVRYVLEMKAEEAARKGITVGSKVPLPLVK